ncbi:DNA topology modulation protein [Oceanobacillus halophilus]|uniref:DNA topology modulation protein n=1 Tax=Oceanobacillus halophilus TaxID=930130 RepID=A0A495A644_9BACI|nr:DNA topology modulation protein [Oceanobacillus halophilus]RKQ33851.1 DNA topology modulation protein [Oceanobacillus halophilus]
MKRIVILGGSGAGKSTLAKQLGSILHIPFYHLDALHWQPGWKPLNKDDFIKKQEEILQQESWIIDGNYSGTMDKRLELADTVIFLHYRTILYLYRITKRRIQYHNKTRPDMGKDCPEKIDWEFFQWVKNFNKEKAPALRKKIAKLENTNVLVFRSPKELNTFLMKLEKTTKKPNDS